MRLRVATYNIRKCVGLDWRRRPDRILAVLAEIGADVVALQEADRRFGTRSGTLPAALLAEFGWTPAPIAPHVDGLGWRGNAVLLGPRARLSAAEPLLLPHLEPRGAALAELSVDGAPLRLVGLHLGLTPPDRTRQARAVLEALATRPRAPTVLLGDLNEPRSGAAALRLLAAHHRLVPPQPTFHASMPIAALDRIAASPDIRVLDAGAHLSALSRRASDHLPLWADLDLPEPEA
jgi:endonuclease/exonuclease/phosphatase family metal-dependent hydrolase